LLKQNNGLILSTLGLAVLKMTLDCQSCKEGDIQWRQWITKNISTI
jgi:hypothetical protein